MAGSNLCTDPSAINEGEPDWRAGVPITRLTGLVGTPRDTGASIVVNGAWTGSLAAGTAPGLSPGDLVSLVGWVRSSVTRPLRCYASIFAGSTFVATVSSGRADLTAAAGVWTEVPLDQALPSGTWDTVYFHVDCPTDVSSTVSVSSVRIDHGTDPDLNYADGDTVGWVWDGPAGNSTSREGEPGSEPDPEPEPDPTIVGGAFPSAPNFYPGTSFSYPGYVDDSGEAPVDPTPVLPPPPSKVAPAPPALVVDAPRSTWLFGIGPAREGGITYELPQTSSRKLSVKLTEGSDAAFEMDGRDPTAIWIDELATDLHVLYRRAPEDARQQLYRGRIGKASDKITKDSHRLSVPSVDYRGVLRRRFLFTGTQQTWTQIDQTAIGWGLINQTQNAAGGGGDLGILDGSTPSGVLRDRSYELQDEIGTKIQELSEVQDGFDWDIVAVNPARLEYQTWYPRRGLDRDVLIELGGAAAELSRDVDSSAFANAIRMTGRAPEGGGAEPPPHERYAADIATHPAGRWEAVIGTDLTTAAAVNDRIDWQLAESQVVRPSYTFTMKRGWWQGPEHCWVGDGVLVKVYSGRVRADTIMRIYQMDFTPDPNGGEAVQVTVNAPKPDPRRRAAAIEQRLAVLERR